jgi:serine O-acetyltransferase
MSGRIKKLINLINRFIIRWRENSFLNAVELVFWYFGYDFPVRYRAIHNSLKFRDIRYYTACDIRIKLPKSTRIGHPVGIVAAGDTDMGENVSIRQNVTIGHRVADYPTGAPTIEDNVEIYAGATVIGDITLHEGCVVGANSVVLDDVDPYTVVAGTPAKPTRKIEKEDHPAKKKAG